MSNNQNIDWEKRRYEMASTLFFQDIKTTDIHGFPYSRTGEWDRFVRCAASDAVLATDIFMRELQKSQEANNDSKNG